MMINGWFVGNFMPTAFSTELTEVAVKKMKAGTIEGSHFHKLASEITYIIQGEVILCNQHLFAGDIAVIEPLEQNAFIAVTDAILVVVKVPGAKNDKYSSLC